MGASGASDESSNLSRATNLYLVFSHAFVYVWFDGGEGCFSSSSFLFKLFGLWVGYLEVRADFLLRRLEAGRLVGFSVDSVPVHALICLTPYACILPPLPSVGLMRVEVFYLCFFVLACFFDAFCVWFGTVQLLFCYGSA